MIDGRVIPVLPEKGMRVQAPGKKAGGATAVGSSFLEITRHPGIARGTRALLKLNQQSGFDCPGCAWPDPDDRRSMVEFCENGVKAVAEEATRLALDEAFFREHSIAHLMTQSDHWLGQQGRLAVPLIIEERDTHYRALEWEEAYRRIAAALNNLPNADAAAFYTSGRTSNEAAFLYQLFVRQFGTNNLPDCSNLCHESSGAALIETIGIGKGTVTLEDFEKTDLVIVVGQNPGTNHPRMLATLQRVKRRGARIVSINPLSEVGLERFGHPQEVSGWLGKGTPLADLHVPLRVNGDAALFLALSQKLLEQQKADLQFISQYTDGFEAWSQALASKNGADLLQQAGVDQATFQTLLATVMRAPRIIVTWAMGLTQHKNAVGTIREIVNFLLLTGNVGRPGAGPCPVRGHSNVQGDRTMGIWERPSSAFLDSLQRAFHFDPPRHPGVDVVECIEGMRQGRIAFFMAMGGNFLNAAPDTEVTAAALRRCRMTVHVSTKLNRSHLVPGNVSIILPCLARSDRDVQYGVEQFVTVENSMGVVHTSQGNLKPVSPHLRSEPAIVAEIAAATLTSGRTHIPWQELKKNYDLIRDLIARTFPAFRDFNDRVRKPGGFYLPNAVRDERRFETATGKARFTINAPSDLSLRPGEFILMTIRSHDQYNTTIYGLDDRYRGIYGGRRVIFLNEADCQARGLISGDIVDLVSSYNGVERRAVQFRVVFYQIPAGCAAAYFPETNVLVPLDQFAAISQTPISKSVIITIQKSGAVA